MDQGRKLIVKNTAFLYFRMLFVMFVSFYTSRLILQNLGTIDFGLYNVVGGLISMMSIMTVTVALGYQRFQNIAIVSENPAEYKKVVSVSFGIQFIIAGIAVLLGETIGLWFLNTQMTIPVERMFAANLIYQNSVILFVLGLIQTPLHAIITAHERFDIYAYVSIFTSITKLAVAIILGYVFVDRLIVYGSSFLILELCTFLINFYFSKKIYTELSLKPSFDRKLLKEMFGFSAWTLFGSLASLLKGNGLNILLNIFFGPTINAARGIAYQVSGAAEMLHNNIQISVRPQIVQNYAKNNFQEMNSLVYFASRASFLLMFLVSLPLLFSTQFVLNVWLGNTYPEYTIVFVRLVVLTALFSSMANPITTVVQSTGRIKLYEIACGSIIILIVPVAYVILKFGGAPPSALYVSLIITILVHMARLIIVRRLVNFPINMYFIKVLWPCIRVAIVSVLAAIAINHYISNEWLKVLSLVSENIIVIFAFGFYKREQKEIISYAINFIRRK